MAGRGPAPKDPARRAGHIAKADRNGVTVLYAEPVFQPELPTFDISIELDGEIATEEFVWPERTRSWWRMWAESPLSMAFTQTDWDFLLDTALIHAKFWQGDSRVAGELRLRVAKFGATPEDRARLRIQFAQADDADEKRQRRLGTSARDRRGPLTA